MRQAFTTSLRAALLLAVAAPLTGANAQQAATALEAIRVTGGGSSTEEYKVENTRSATRTDTPIKEIPQSVSVISRDVLEDLGEASGIDAALELGGVGRANDYAGSIGTYTVRGFTSNAIFRNGMNQGSNNTTAPDPSGIESVDVLRGPSSLTLGAGDPGGAFNIVSKQPLDYSAYEFGLTADTHGGRRGTADLTGPFNQAGTLLYRVNLALNDSKSFRDYIHTNREYVAPRFTLKIAPETRVLLDLEWQRAKAPIDRGIPIYANLLYGPPSRNFFHGEPSAKRLTSKNFTGQLRLEHEFSENWSLDAGLQRIKGDIHGQAIEVSGLRPDRRTLTRRILARENFWNSTLGQGFLKGKFRLGNMEHQVLLGAEYRRGLSGLQWYTNATPWGSDLDVYNPVYGAPLPALTVYNRHLGTYTHNRAFVLQDQVRITEHTRVLAGVRYEKFSSRAYDYFAKRFTPTKNSALTPRLGASYNFSSNVTGYVSYARSFKPTASLDINGNTLKPERGQSWEAGVKTELFDQRLQVTTALFHIVKQNVPTADPNDINFNIAAGEVRSRGIDVDVSGRIGQNLRVAGYMAWVDAEVTKDNRLRVGARQGDIPEFRARLMGFYALGGALQGMEVGAGWQYVGHRVTSSQANALTMPSYTTVDFMVNYQINPNAKLRLSLKNAFDRNYLERNAGSSAMPGDPRTVYATLEYKL